MKTVFEIYKELIRKTILGEDWIAFLNPISKNPAYDKYQDNFEEIVNVCSKIGKTLQNPYKLFANRHFANEIDNLNPKYFNEDFIGILTSYFIQKTLHPNDNVPPKVTKNTVTISMQELSLKHGPLCHQCGTDYWKEFIFSEGKVELKAHYHDEKKCPLKSLEQTFNIQVSNSLSFFNFLNDEQVFSKKFIEKDQFLKKYNIQYPNGRFNLSKKYSQKNIGYVQCGQGVNIYKHKNKNEIILTTGTVSKEEKKHLKDFIKKGTIRGDVWRAMFTDVELTNIAIPQNQDKPIKVKMAKGKYAIKYNEIGSKSIIATICKAR